MTRSDEDKEWIFYQNDIELGSVECVDGGRFIATRCDPWSCWGRQSIDTPDALAAVEFIESGDPFSHEFL